MERKLYVEMIVLNPFSSIFGISIQFFFYANFSLHWFLYLSFHWFLLSSIMYSVWILFYLSFLFLLFIYLWFIFRFRSAAYLNDATNPDLVERQMARQLTLRINKYYKKIKDHFAKKLGLNWSRTRKKEEKIS